MDAAAIRKDTFHPALLSDEELAFLLDNLGKPPVAALHKIRTGDYPGVNPVAIHDTLNVLYDNELLRQHEGVAWCGFEAIAGSIERYLGWRAKSIEIRKRSRGRIAHPSQFQWDGDGQPHRYGIGADSGDMVRTEILSDGSRQAFEVALHGTPESMLGALNEVADWLPGSPTAPTKPADEVVEARKGQFGTYTCSICGKSENFKTASRHMQNLARARMVRHLTSAREEINRHRLLLRKFKG